MLLNTKVLIKQGRCIILNLNNKKLLFIYGFSNRIGKKHWFVNKFFKVDLIDLTKIYIIRVLFE